jgi:hypothetical protein
MPFTNEELKFNYDHNPNHCTAQPTTTCGEEYAIWPGPIVPIPGTSAAYQFYGLVFRGGDVSGFLTRGIGIAVEIGGKLTRPILTPGTTYPTLLWQGDEVGYSGGWLVENGLVYMIGCKGVFVTDYCSIARAPIVSVLDKGAWRYFAGNDTWSTDENAAVSVFEGGAAGNSIFYDKALGEYIAIYSQNFSNDLYYRAALHPWGPWSDQQLLFHGTQGESGTSDYAGLAHPEFAEQDGLVEYVTYVQTTGFLQQDIQLVRVTFAKP